MESIFVDDRSLMKFYKKERDKKESKERFIQQFGEDPILSHIIEKKPLLIKKTETGGYYIEEGNRIVQREKSRSPQLMWGLVILCGVLFYLFSGMFISYLSGEYTTPEFVPAALLLILITVFVISMLVMVVSGSITSEKNVPLEEFIKNEYKDNINLFLNDVKRSVARRFNRSYVEDKKNGGNKKMGILDDFEDNWYKYLIAIGLGWLLKDNKTVQKTIEKVRGEVDSFLDESKRGKKK